MVFQFLRTFITLSVVYFVYVCAAPSEFDTVRVIGLFTNESINAVLASFYTTVICLILGAPIRLIKTVNRWWRKRAWLCFGGILLGSFFLLLAWHPKFAGTVYLEPSYHKRVAPDDKLAEVGWWILGFFLLHSYLTDAYRQIASKLMNSWES